MSRFLTTCGLRFLMASAFLLLVAHGTEAQTTRPQETTTGQGTTDLTQQGANPSSQPEQIRNSERDLRFDIRTMQEREAENRRLRAIDGNAAFIELPSEFQLFVYASTGYRLEMFGRDLFTGVPATFAPVDRIPVTADYVVGPGDEIMLRGWGQIDIDYRAVVDRVGNIFVPKVGNISVAGLKYKDLQPYLKNSIGKVFHDFDLNVTLGQLRSIQVFVVGQAKRPGSYTVSSLSTLVNAVFASGGPSNKGSMRHIQLKRGERVVTEFDLYDLLINGDKSKDVQLLSGDVIHIPTIGRSVAVVGSINVPAIYEIGEKATFGEIIRNAGGITPTAMGRSAVIERVTDHTVRTVEELQLDDVGLKRPLQDGDLITIRALSDRFDNAITLRGNVAVPGRYAWKSGVRIRDVIPDRDALITRNFWQKQQDLGKDSFLLKSKGLVEKDGSIERSELGSGTDNRRNESEGNPRTARKDGAEGTEILSDSDKKQSGSRRSTGEQALTNDIKRNAPDINWDYAVIQRLNRENLTTRLIPFNLGKAIADPNDPANLVLEAGDTITIFSQRDIKVPLQKQSKFVRLEGEFNVPGVYEVGPGETLTQLITRVGGITAQAYLFGAEFTRESTREAQQKRLDQFVEQLDRDVERTSSTRSQNVLSAEEAAGIAQKADSQRRLVEKLRQVSATGRVVLGLKPTEVAYESLPDLVLEDGDRFFVPYQPAVVNVLGAVYNENSFLHQTSRRASRYLQMAGGTTREADSSRTFIVRADGSIVSGNTSSRWFGGGIDQVRVMPGDSIVVPERLDKVSWLKGLKDWSQVIGQFALGAAAIRTLNRP